MPVIQDKLQIKYLKNMIGCGYYVRQVKISDSKFILKKLFQFVCLFVCYLLIENIG